jgi:hypothetical protein
MSTSEKPRERWMIRAELAAKKQDTKKLLAFLMEINEPLEESQPPSRFALPPMVTSACGHGDLRQEVQE